MFFVLLLESLVILCICKNNIYRLYILDHVSNVFGNVHIIFIDVYILIVWDFIFLRTMGPN